LALRARDQKALAAAQQSEAASASSAATEPVVSKQDAATAHQMGYRAFLFTRVPPETKGAFQNFASWSAAAAASARSAFFNHY
jgi:hypothetical protein